MRIFLYLSSCDIRIDLFAHKTLFFSVIRVHTITITPSRYPCLSRIDAQLVRGFQASPFVPSTHKILEYL